MILEINVILPNRNATRSNLKKPIKRQLIAPIIAIVTVIIKIIKIFINLYNLLICD